ncbi:hypothetical protein PybrP1_010167 [[Pythium] brassicae (nom. inval.)]|nr:hypothetical protein PybrP1_010167 [[Pythium] brassicae (nom. inval.)]
MNWRDKEWVAIKSLPGGSEQKPHRDFTEAEISRTRDVVLYRGDLVHADAHHNTETYHLHCTLTVAGAKWKKSVAEAAPFRVFKCLYCPTTFKTKRQLYNHPRFCSGNPDKLRLAQSYAERNKRGGECHICKKVFPLYNTMIKHRKKCEEEHRKHQ